VFNADLRALGVSVRPIDNGAKAQDVDGYSNLAAECWYAFRRLLERKLVIIPNDPETIKQLTSRRIQYDGQGRIMLEPKAAMRSRGLNSPDRADAGSRLAGGQESRVRDAHSADGARKREVVPQRDRAVLRMPSRLLQLLSNKEVAQPLRGGRATLAHATERGR
jgi:hypothetical protein